MEILFVLNIQVRPKNKVIVEHRLQERERELVRCQETYVLGRGNGCCKGHEKETYLIHSNASKEASGAEE